MVNLLLTVWFVVGGAFCDELPPDWLRLWHSKKCIGSNTQLAKRNSWRKTGGFLSASPLREPRIRRSLTCDSLLWLFCQSNVSRGEAGLTVTLAGDWNTGAGVLLFAAQPQWRGRGRVGEVVFSVPGAAGRWRGRRREEGRGRGGGTELWCPLLAGSLPLTERHWVEGKTKGAWLFYFLSKPNVCVCVCLSPHLIV